MADINLAVQYRIAIQELVITFAKPSKFPPNFQLYIIDCRTTFLGLLWWWRSSGWASRLGDWVAILDTLDRSKRYPQIKSSKLLQEVIWRLLLVMHLKQKDF